jgi:hypothetical protein
MDDLIERLGQAHQKAMSLTVQNRTLKKRAKVAEERAEILEELVMDIVADCREGVKDYEIAERIRKVMQKLDGDK